MKKKIYIRPVSVVLTEEMFNRIQAITDQAEVGISDYIRDAVKEKLSRENINKKEEE